MPPAKKKPGAVAIRQAEKGNYRKAVRIVKRAMTTEHTKPVVAARSRNIIRSDVGMEVFKRAKNQLKRGK